MRALVSMPMALMLSAIAEVHGADSRDTQLVPFVGCPGNGQTGPVAAPTNNPVPVDVDRKTAVRLAYYKGAFGSGVFAPVGWHCRQWYGSSGASIVVTPEAPADTFPAQPVTGPGVELVQKNGGTSGRFEMAAVSARFFPRIMDDFIQRVRNEQPSPESTLDVKPYPKDRVKSLGDWIVDFSTPAGREGFGTEGLLRPSSQPIDGLVALSPPADEPTISVLRVRLPRGQDTLSASIVRLAARCMTRPQGC